MTIFGAGSRRQCCARKIGAVTKCNRPAFAEGPRDLEGRGPWQVKEDERRITRRCARGGRLVRSRKSAIALPLTSAHRRRYFQMREVTGKQRGWTYLYSDRLGILDRRTEPLSCKTPAADDSHQLHKKVSNLNSTTCGVLPVRIKRAQKNGME